VIVNNQTTITKTNNHLSSLLIEYNNTVDIKYSVRMTRFQNDLHIEKTRT